MVKTTASQKKKRPELALKASPLASSSAAAETTLGKSTDAVIVKSQYSAIPQLTEQVLQIILKNKHLLDSIGLWPKWRHLCQARPPPSLDTMPEATEVNTRHSQHLGEAHLN